MDDERLKNGGSVLTVEYFDRLLEQIREIRLSERRFYQKITDSQLRLPRQKQKRNLKNTV